MYTYGMQAVRNPKRIEFCGKTGQSSETNSVSAATRNVPAKFHCVATHDERTEFFTEGTVEFTPTAVYFNYDTESYGVRIGVSDDIVTITRLGQDNYTMLLQEGKETVFGVGPFSFFLHTEKLRFKRGENKLDLLAQYRLGDGERYADAASKVLIHATY